ncbi:MAG: HPr(Ser) kinase/phosphatase, partial [Clostridiales bacterium]|nr:HPr(Ser) kinase/phosphatase [Clostridiales bacterium]
ECARTFKTPVFRSSKMTTSVMADLFVYLNRLLAPATTVHGVLMDVFGVGIMLTGNSGVGKSETAMELIKRGHRLVADDSVLIKRVENELVGTAPERIRYFMELRGIGIINVKNMYGSGSVLNEKQIEFVMEMEPWQQGKEYDRIGGEQNVEEILGVKIPKLVIPVSPGRNLAILIEVAARNQRLKSMCYDAAQELIQRTIGR